MATRKESPIGNQECSAANTVEDACRRCLPFLEIADPILRIASSKNPNIAPVSAMVSGVVSSLKRYFSAGKKTNPVALNNILDLLKDVNPKMSEEDAQELVRKLRTETKKLETSK